MTASFTPAGLGRYMIGVACAGLLGLAGLLATGQAMAQKPALPAQSGGRPIM